MAVKTFTSTTLSSSDVNTYLANAGLVYITQASATSGSSLSVDNVFSSTYSNYRIMIDAFQPASAARGLVLRLRVGGVDASNADYYYALLGGYVDGTSSSTYGNASTFADTGIYNSTNTLPIGNSAIDVFGPNRAERTYFGINSTLYNTQFGGRAGFAEHNLTTAYTGFSLMPASGNFTNIRVWVYGYRNS